MPVARTCLKCNRKFLAKKDEQYCAQCAKDELMAILGKPKEDATKKVKEVKEEVKVKTKCKRCGKEFEQTGKGRPAVNCPTCREELSKTKEKVAPKKNSQPKKVKEVTPVISKKETTESYITSKTAGYLYGDANKNDIQISNVVDHPSHYNRGKIEVIDFIEDQGLSFHLGNVIKYIARAGSKGDKLEDLKKSTVVFG